MRGGEEGEEKGAWGEGRRGKRSQYEGEEAMERRRRESGKVE